MYFFLFDSYTTQPRYAKEVDLIKLKLADLGIIDEQAKASPLYPVELLVRQAIFRKKYRNIIAVGNDRTGHLVINEIIKSKEDITFGLIPIGDSQIANLCGMAQGVNACEIISARKLECVDLAKIDRLVFLTSFEIYPQKVKKFWGIFDNFLKPELLPIEIDFKDEDKFENNFKIQAETVKIIIANLLPENIKTEIEKHTKTPLNIDPYDDFLNIIVLTRGSNKKSSVSIFKSRSLRIKAKKLVECFIDGQKTKRFSNYISVKPQAINLIVGKNRKF